MIVYSLTNYINFIQILSIIGTYSLNLLSITFFTIPVVFFFNEKLFNKILIIFIALIVFTLNTYFGKSIINEFNSNKAVKYICSPIGVNFDDSNVDFFTITYNRKTETDADLTIGSANDLAGMRERINMCLGSEARFTFIYLRLESYLGVAHANFLLIDNKTHKCLRIEPHGFQAGGRTNTHGDYIPTNPALRVDVLLNAFFLSFGIQMISHDVFRVLRGGLERNQSF